MPIKRYDANEATNLTPKSLTGMVATSVYLVQSVDERQQSSVLIGVDVGQGDNHDLRFLPTDTWEKTARPSAWLKKQIEAWFEKQAQQRFTPGPTATAQPLTPLTAIKDLGDEEL